ncbi:P-type conjugative transfer protein TrbL (plasmid) [Prosthecochloris aestuarii DSM 271]|uniref:P-type conjugative transfer protein TrbL n=1 Tax=Prosthecochloris aestuarii (strain DSM 271 / SK 413) TaxID=290512 RepID=B4S9L6_PROA2|nr:P-type conjugative transfer protein TrbL [Prosthecochloris aestuarii]ACF47343.1 P-type conjugative transfer protein TrbL [Prosthecochloris aestuarii DSM 271]
MNTGILTSTLHTFIDAFNAGYAKLYPHIEWLIWVMLGIELVMLGLWWALGGGEQLAAVMKKLLYLLVWLWIVQNFQTLAKTFVWSLAEAGEIAGGRTPDHKLLTDPTAIINIGLDISAPLADQVGREGWDIGNALAFSLMWLMSALAFLIMGWQMFYALLEFYILITLVGILLPFGFFEPTKFMAEKSIGAVISSGVKLMVLSFIIAISHTILTSLPIPSGFIDLETGLTIVLISGAIAFLAWNAPGIAAGLVVGSPSLSAATGAQNALAAGLAGGGALVATAAAGKFAATKVASLAGKFGSVSTKSGQMASLAKAGGVGGIDGPGGPSQMGATPGGSPGGSPSGTPSGGSSSSGEDRNKSSGKKNPPKWAQQALQASRHIPEEARPSGGDSSPKL